MTLTHNPLSKRITIELRLDLKTLHKLNAIADKRGDEYLASLPDQPDEDEE